MHPEQRRPAASRNDIRSTTSSPISSWPTATLPRADGAGSVHPECLAIDVGQRPGSRDVVATLERLRHESGLPERIYCNNGTEFVSAAMDLWEYTNTEILDFSRSGKPTDKQRSNRSMGASEKRA